MPLICRAANRCVGYGMVGLQELLDRHQVLLAEGAIIERIRRNRLVPLDPFVADANLVSDKRGKLLLTRIHREYIDIGQEFKLPMVVLTPTWRASAERVERAGLKMDVNEAAVRLISQLCSRYKSYRRLMTIGGLVGPKGDAYRPATALSSDAAMRYHKPQVEALAFAGVDFILASTLPAVSEATGIARACNDVGMPCVLSFVVRPSGEVLDGHLLAAAIRKVQENVMPWPVGFMVNCVHPANFRGAVEHMAATPDVKRRVIGLQANTSRKSPETLDGAKSLDAEEPGEFGRQMAEVRREMGLRIVGGCCGTDATHIRALAEALTRA